MLRKLFTLSEMVKIHSLHSIDDVLNYVRQGWNYYWLPNGTLVDRVEKARRVWRNHQKEYQYQVALGRGAKEAAQYWIAATPILCKYYYLLTADCPEGDLHYRWIHDAPVKAVIEWAIEQVAAHGVISTVGTTKAEDNHAS